MRNDGESLIWIQLTLLISLSEDGVFEKYKSDRPHTQERIGFGLMYHDDAGIKFSTC